jgi:hypothetical protein
MPGKSSPELPAARLVYRGAREIGAAAGINWKELTLYVQRYGLPAFKIDGRGTWLARPASLDRWLSDQEARYLPRGKK